MLLAILFERHEAKLLLDIVTEGVLGALPNRLGGGAPQCIESCGELLFLGLDPFFVLGRGQGLDVSFNILLPVLVIGSALPSDFLVAQSVSFRLLVQSLYL